MSRLLHWLLPFFLIGPCLAEPSETFVASAIGELRLSRIDELKLCELAFGDRSLFTAPCETQAPPKLIRRIINPLGPMAEVLVFQEQPAGNACNGGPLHIVGISRRLKFLETRSIDFCNGAEPVFTLNGSAITITLTPWQTSSGEIALLTTRWLYSNGRLKKLP
jgi:hypothetical protein